MIHPPCVTSIHNFVGVNSDSKVINLNSFKLTNTRHAVAEPRNALFLRDRLMRYLLYELTTTFIQL